MIQCAILAIPERMKKKMQFLLYCFFLDSLIRNEKNNFRGIQNKKPLEIIMQVVRVTSLLGWVAKKSGHGQTLINECSIFVYLSNFNSLRFAASRTKRHDCVFSVLSYALRFVDCVFGVI